MLFGIFLLHVICMVADAQFGAPRRGFGENENFGLDRFRSGGGSPTLGVGGGNGGNELTYEAKGRLICGISGVEKVRVVMWDRVHGTENLVYDEVETDVVGNFRVRGVRNGFDGAVMQPYLTIYHDCGHESTPGLRKMIVKLPPNYTNRGSLVLKSFDIGTWNLETTFAGEELETLGRSQIPIGGRREFDQPISN